MPKFTKSARAELLQQGPRLRASALSQVADFNASYLLVHNVLAEALRSDAAKTSRTGLDAALSVEIDRYFRCERNGLAS